MWKSKQDQEMVMYLYIKVWHCTRSQGVKSIKIIQQKYNWILWADVTTNSSFKQLLLIQVGSAIKVFSQVLSSFPSLLKCPFLVASQRHIPRKAGRKRASGKASETGNFHFIVFDFSSH